MKYNIQENSGFSLATIEDTSSKIVTAVLSADLHEKNTVSDQATYTVYEDALLAGAGKYSREEFLHQLGLMGASVSVSISNGVITFVLKATSETYSKLLNIFKEVLLQPTFAKSEVERIKTIKKNELREAKEDSKTIAHKELRNHLYNKTDRRYLYSYDKISQEVSSITNTDLKKIHTSFCNKSWTVSMYGNGKNISATEKLLRTVKKSPQSKGKIPTHSQKVTAPKVLLTNIPSRQNIDFSIGVQTPITLHHPDYAPLTLAIAILGKPGFAGRLMSTVRELEGLTYSIYAYIESCTGTEQGYWRIFTFFSPKQSIQGLNSTFREIKKLHKEGVSQKELDQFKLLLSTQQKLVNDSPVSQLMQLHAFHQQGFSLEEMNEFKGRIMHVTLSEINTVIRNYFNPKNLSISAAGPIKEVEKELKKYL